MCFVFYITHDGGFIGGIYIGCLRFEFGVAGVDVFEHGCHIQIMMRAAHVIFGLVGQCG